MGASVSPQVDRRTDVLASLRIMLRDSSLYDVHGRVVVRKEPLSFEWVDVGIIGEYAESAGDMLEAISLCVVARCEFV